MVGGEQLKGPGEDVKGQCYQIVYLLNPSTSFGPLIFGHHIGTNINFSLLDKPFGCIALSSFQLLVFVL